MSTPHLDRRGFLKGAGALFALPHFPSLRSRGAAAAPRDASARAVWVYFPNGVAEGSWRPDADRRGRLRRLNPRMQPLEPHRDDLLFVDHLFTPRGNGHGAGTATWLTGEEWDHRALSAGGPSVDQIAARAIGRDCIAPSLELGTRGEGFFATDLPRNHISWAEAQRPLFRETDPRAVFERLFGTTNRDDSILDAVKEQADALRRRLGRADRENLEQYLEAVRGLERRTAFAADERTRKLLDGARGRGLTILDAEPAADGTDHVAAVDQTFDLIALALWTGATRLATFMLDHGQSNRYCPFVDGVSGTWHALSHWRDASGDTEDDDGVTRWDDVDSKRSMYDRVVRWHHERLARFLDQLRSLPVGEGTLLDHTLVTYGSSIADGHEHAEEDLPILLAGGRALGVRSGRLLNPRGRDEVDFSSLQLAKLRALGVPRDEFGGCDEPLDWT